MCFYVIRRVFVPVVILRIIELTWLPYRKLFPSVYDNVCLSGGPATEPLTSRGNPSHGRGA